MTLTQLANFVHIAELRSLSKAAAVVRIAQPALSRQVRALEAELGAPLLIRHGWGVSLSPAGEVLLVRARRLLLEAEAARDAVHALAAEPSGRVAIGVPTSVATALLPPLARALRDRYPALRPHFVDGFSAVLHARTLAGDLDLAALYEDRVIGPLATAPLLSEDLMLVGPAGAEPPSPGRQGGDLLGGTALILPARPNRLRLIVDAARAQHAASGPALMEVDSLPAIVSMVRQGLGFTVLPYSAVALDVARGDLQVWPLGKAGLSRTLLLVRPLDRQPTAAVAAVEAELRALVATLAPELRWRALAVEAG